MAKGMAEYEKAETEAFDILKRGGWLSMERYFTGPQVRSFLEISTQAQYQPGVDQPCPSQIE